MSLATIFAIESFVFVGFKIDKKRSIVTFEYRVHFTRGFSKTFKDRLTLDNVREEHWSTVPDSVLTPTLQALLIMIGINYWSTFPTSNIKIEGFTLTRAQADFWNTVYTKGLAEYFYLAKIDFRGLINFPYEESKTIHVESDFRPQTRSLLLNGAGKDSILSAEILKKQNVPFDYFTVAPTVAHRRIARLVGEYRLSVPGVDMIQFWVHLFQVHIRLFPPSRS
jgi:hypothetical protein